MAEVADRLGLDVHAGHGLTYQNVGAVARVAQVVELNIGHSIIARSIYTGITDAVASMRVLMDQARTDARMDVPPQD